MIVESFNNGNTYHDVAKEFNVSISKVHFYVEWFQNTGDVNTAQIHGQARKTDIKTDFLIRGEE